MSHRPSKRKIDELRAISFELGFAQHAEGSCLTRFGNTVVLCTATIEDNVPSFLKNKGQGWVTAEYGMLPRSTHSRIDREAARGKQTGRTQEIQRLIGRSLRAITNIKGFGERQIKIDCDVIQADGGTRTASISGAYLALFCAFQHMVNKKQIAAIPLTQEVAAISCGIYQGVPILDLDYDEDSGAAADANFILNGKGDIIEIQTTAEETPFPYNQFETLYQLAHKGINEIIHLQRQTLLKWSKS